MLGLLYYGRLEKEKGFDSLLEAIRILNGRNSSLPPHSSSSVQNDRAVPQFELFIFGKGTLESELLPLVGQNVHFFGFQPLSKIRQYVENVDYCLMPSEFLETFGLVALNALSWGLPVIGYKKGGLEPFILPDCNLFVYKGQDTTAKLVSCIEKLSQLSDQELQEKKSGYQTAISELLGRYSREGWYQRFGELCKPLPGENPPYPSSSQPVRGAVQKRIKVVLVSDFINKIGGIETYLHDAKGILESREHEVLLRGGYLPKGWRGKLRIYLGLLLTPVNFWDAWRFKRFLKREKPDLIFFNSLLRNLGRGVVKEAIKYKNIKVGKCKSIRVGKEILCSQNLSPPFLQKRVWMMYHDFGYFFPFPHKLFHVEDCKTPLNLKNFMCGVKTSGWGTKLAVWFKYLWMKGLVKALKKSVDLHLVPSEFMIEVVSKSYGIPPKKVKTFNHFIQK